MIPISESVRVRKVPWVTASLVFACVLVFLYELTLPARQLDIFIERWGVDSQLVLAALAGNPRVPRGLLLTLFTSQFLHADWLHLLFNMVFLWVFGRAVEDRFGHLLYLVIYLSGGAAAGLFQAWVSGPSSGMVMIGASGAIATVLGAYLISYPTAWVKVVVPIFFFFWAFDVPAVIMLALWFFGQFLTGLASISRAAVAGNVAVWAHVAGFVVGVAVGLAGPRQTGFGQAGRGARREGGPGPAGLISSVESLVGLALGLRIVLHFLLIRPGPGPVGQVAGMIYLITEPLVRPIEPFVPSLRILGFPLDLPALVAMLIVYFVALLLIHAVSGDRGE